MMHFWHFICAVFIKFDLHKTHIEISIEECPAFALMPILFVTFVYILFYIYKSRRRASSIVSGNIILAVKWKERQCARVVHKLQCEERPHFIDIIIFFYKFLFSLGIWQYEMRNIETMCSDRCKSRYLFMEILPKAFTVHTQWNGKLTTNCTNSKTKISTTDGRRFDIARSFYGVLIMRMWNLQLHQTFDS